MDKSDVQYNNASAIMSKVLQDLGMTVVDFADACGVKYGRISDVIRGRTKRFTPVLVKEICSSFPQINKDFLYTGEGEPLKDGYMAMTTLSNSPDPKINKQVNDLMNLQQDLLNKQALIMSKLEELHQRELAVAKREYEVQIKEIEVKQREQQAIAKEAEAAMLGKSA